MTRTEFIKALREENKLHRKLTGEAITNHVTINGIIIYYNMISKISFTELTCDIYVRNSDGYNNLLLMFFYSDIQKID